MESQLGIRQEAKVGKW